MRVLHGCTIPSYGKASDLSNLVSFGTWTWVKIVNAGKLDSHAEPRYFVGFDNDSASYRIYFPDKQVVKAEGEVVFNINQIGNTVMIPGEVLSEGEKQKLIQDRPKKAKVKEHTNDHTQIPYPI
jgi:hypothetical protein